MPAYRMEYANSARAGCQGTSCKKEGAKIGKGDIRFGTWVDVGKFAGWRWRHFGCITSAVLRNVKKEYNNIKDEMDGFEEMREEDQEKFMTAVEKETLEVEDMTPALRPQPKTESEEEAEKEGKPKTKRKRKTKADVEAVNGKTDAGAEDKPDEKEKADQETPKAKKTATPRKAQAKKPVKSKKAKKAQSDEEEEVLSDSEAIETPELSSEEEEAVETEDEEAEQESSKRKKIKTANKKTTKEAKSTPKKRAPSRAAKTKSKAIVESDEGDSAED